MLDGGPKYMEEEDSESPEETYWTEGWSEEEEEEGYVSEEERNPGLQQRVGGDSWLWGSGMVHTNFQPGGSQLVAHPPLIPCNYSEGITSSPFCEVLQPGSWRGGTHVGTHLTCAVPPTDSCIRETNPRISRKSKPSAVEDWQAKASSPGLLSSRILSHPSFISYYTAMAILQRSQGPVGSPHGVKLVSVDPAHQRIKEERSGIVLPINYSDFFYTDPLMTPGHRIYNCLSPQSQQVFQCFRLNTPPPIMSSCEQSTPRRSQVYTDFYSSGVPRTSNPIVAGEQFWTKWLSIAEHDALNALLNMTSQGAACAQYEPDCEPTIPSSKVYTNVKELQPSSQDVFQEGREMLSPCNIKASSMDLQTLTSFEDQRTTKFSSLPYEQEQSLLEGESMRLVRDGGQELWQEFLNQEACERTGNPYQSNFETLEEHQYTMSTNSCAHISKEASNTQAQEAVENAEWETAQEGLDAPVLGQAHSRHYSQSEHIAISALLDLQFLKNHKLLDEQL